MRRCVAFNFRLVLLVLGLCLGPTALSIDRAFCSPQSTIRSRNEQTKPAEQKSQTRRDKRDRTKIGRQPATPPASPIPTRTPSLPTNVTLRISITSTAEDKNPRFALLTKSDRTVQVEPLQRVQKQGASYMKLLGRGMDPTKQYWIRVEEGTLRGEAPLAQPRTSDSNVFVNVALYETVQVEIKIEDYATYRPATVAIGPVGSQRQSLVPYQINSNGTASFPKGIDIESPQAIYVGEYDPKPITSEDLVDGRLEKTIKLSESVQTPLGGNTEPLDPGWDAVIAFLKSLIAPAIGIVLLGLIAVGFVQLRKMWVKPSEPDIVMSQPRTHRSAYNPRSVAKTYPAVTDYRSYGEEEDETPAITHPGDSKLGTVERSEPETQKVPFQLSRKEAREAYKSLIDNGSLSPEPLTLDIMLSDSPNKKGEQLKETMDPGSKFILFTNGNEKGWLFPNPAPWVRETKVEQTWQLLFEGLTKDEFERKMERLYPIEASRSNSGGKNTWNAKRKPYHFE